MWLKKGKYLRLILGLTIVMALVLSISAPGVTRAILVTRGTLVIFKFKDLDGDGVYELSLIHISEPTRPY